MTFFTKYGQPVAGKTTKKLSTKDLLLSNIEKQRKLLTGQEVKGNKGKPIRSWFAGFYFNPKIGIYSLFEGKNISCSDKTDERLQMLNDFAKAVEAGEFDNFINAINGKRK